MIRFSSVRRFLPLGLFMLLLSSWALAQQTPGESGRVQVRLEGPATTLQGEAEASADPSSPDNWVTDGAVWAIVRDGTTVYIGGSFSYVGPNTGCGVPLSASTGSPAATFPNVNETVMAVAPDGSGGWYIGGTFTEVAGVSRNHIAHILSNGALDVSWDPNADEHVRTLAVSGSTVYAGGGFTSIGGQTRNHIAALDRATGTATSWDPDANTWSML